MKTPERLFVEVCEDGIFAFPEPPFEESVEYIRADLVPIYPKTSGESRIMTREMIEGRLLQNDTESWNEDYDEEGLQARFGFYTYKDEPGVLYLSNLFVEEASRYPSGR